MSEPLTKEQVEQQIVEFLKFRDVAGMKAQLEQLQAEVATLTAQLAEVRGPDTQVGSYAWYRKEFHRMHLVIHQFCVLEEQLKMMVKGDTA